VWDGEDHAAPQLCVGPKFMKAAMDSKRTSAYGCIGVIIAVIIALAVFLFYPCGYTHVATVQIGDKHSIVVSAEDCWEISQGLAYQIPASLLFARFGGTIESTDDLKFIALESESSNLVAIVEAANPDVVLVLHDFKDGNSWPYRHDTENYLDANIRGESMLTRVKEEYPNKQLILSSKVPGNRKLKIYY
jgi:hypothetical protein